MISHKAQYVDTLSQRWYLFFARAGFTEAARQEAEQLGAWLLTLEEMAGSL
jgi:hypothetical protein